MNLWKESVKRLYEALQRTTHRASRELLLSRSTIHKVLHKRLRLCAYKVQFVQELKPGDGMARQRFAEEMLDRIDLDMDFLKKSCSQTRQNFMSRVKFTGIICAYGALKTHMLLGSTYAIVRK
jgi:hypothetical protein